MNVRSLVPVTAIAVACLGIASGTAHGAPAPTPVQYSATIENNAVVTTLDGGAFKLSSDARSVAVEDAGGNVVTNFPLEMPFHDVAYPIAARISDGDTRLELVPTALPLHNVATVEENDIATRAFNKLFYSPQSGIGAGIGGTLGVIVGALLGGLAGCLAGAVLTAGVGSPIGCPVGAVVGAVAGGGGLGFATAFAGVAIAGGQPLYQAWEDMYYTVTGAPWTSKFYDNPNNGLQQNTPIPVEPQP